MASSWPQGLPQSLVIQYSRKFLSPPVLMHGGLICVAFCLSVCDWAKTTGQKSTSQEPYELGSSKSYLCWKHGVFDI